MMHLHTNNLRLTDDLERRLVQQAVSQQQRLRPLLALKNTLKRLFA